MKNGIEISTLNNSQFEHKNKKKIKYQISYGISTLQTVRCRELDILIFLGIFRGFFGNSIGILTEGDSIKILWQFYWNSLDIL